MAPELGSLTFSKLILCVKASPAWFGLNKDAQQWEEMEFSISACCSEETKLCGNQICLEILLSAFVNLTLNDSPQE